MAVTLAFDVYGTLIDTHGVVAKLEQIVGDRATDFSSTWRDKQLEYSFRRGLMQNYENFAVCTRDALEYTCDRYGLAIGQEDKRALLDIYRELPAFDDVEGALADLAARDCRLFAFSNGSAEAVETLLSAARHPRPLPRRGQLRRCPFLQTEPGRLRTLSQAGAGDR